MRRRAQKRLVSSSLAFLCLSFLRRILFFAERDRSFPPLARHEVGGARQIRLTMFSNLLRWFELRRLQRQHARLSLCACNARLIHFRSRSRVYLKRDVMFSLSVILVSRLLLRVPSSFSFDSFPFWLLADFSFECLQFWLSSLAKFRKLYNLWLLSTLADLTRRTPNVVHFISHNVPHKWSTPRAVIHPTSHGVPHKWFTPRAVIHPISHDPTHQPWCTPQMVSPCIVSDTNTISLIARLQLAIQKILRRRPTYSWPVRILEIYLGNLTLTYHLFDW